MKRIADAIVVFAGRGEDHRFISGLKLWKEGVVKYLLVAGMNAEQNRRFGPYTKEGISRTAGLGTGEKDRLLVLEEARHTAHQAEWVLDMAHRQGLRTLILTTSAYHLPRAFLTVLKAMMKRGHWLKIIPMALHAPWKISLGELRYIPSEFKRIVEYQKKGDVATFPELVNYLRGRR